MSSTRSRTVSAAVAAVIAASSSALSNASSVASNRVPTSTPAAPRTRAAASPRPSPIPPAASTGVPAATSTTAGTKGSVPRPSPCPPASAPCATTTSAPRSSARCASGSVVTWIISVIPASRTAETNGVGSPNDSMIAAGSSAMARCTVASSMAHDSRPMPQGRSVPARASAHSRAIQSPAPPPAPIRPKPPPLETAAVSAPPATPPIGANTIGCSMPSRSVRAVRNAMPKP